MEKNTSAIRQIVDKLGWNDIPSKVAYDAIQIMIRNYINGYADCSDDYIGEDSTLDIMSNYLDADTLWLCLFIYDYQTLEDTKMQAYALHHRYDIEESMRNGLFFNDAKRGWNI